MPFLPLRLVHGPLTGGVFVCLCVCLGRIINYWPQAHAVPDRPAGETLCTEIPPLEKEKKKNRKKV